jgi:cytochrome c556
MRLPSKSLIGMLALCASVAIAAEATDPAARARQELMGVIGMNMKTLGDMAGGKSAFDAAAAETAKAALIAAAAEIPATFETQSSDPKSKAKPEIWADFEHFRKEADELGEAAAALDVASVDTLKAGLGAVGGVCKDCHTEYRSE